MQETSPTEWLTAVPAIVVAALVLQLPGLLVCAAAGIRGLRLWGMAGAVSVGLIAISAVLTSRIGVGWNPLVPALAALVMFGTLARRRRGYVPPASPTRTRYAALAGLVVGGALISASLVLGIGKPGAVSQSYDGVFHATAVRWVLDTGIASSLEVGRSVAVSGVYPAAWHDLVSLVVQITGAEVPLATNAMAIAVAVVVWPAGCAALARVVLPCGAAGPVAAAVLAGAFPVFPSLLLIWGVVLPTYLSVALLPGVAALFLGLLLGLTTVDPVPSVHRPIAHVAVAVVALAGLGLAHPSAVFSLVVLVGPLALVVGADEGRRHLKAGRRPQVLLAGASLLASMLLLVLAVSRSETLRSVWRFSWPAEVGPLAALREGLLGEAPSLTGPTWGVSVLVVAGVALLVLRRRRRALVVTWVLAVIVYVAARSTDTHILSGGWYNDSRRVAPLVAISALLIAASVFSEVAGRWVNARSGCLAALLVPLLAASPPVSGLGQAVDALAVVYRSPVDSTLLSEHERGFLEQVADELPEGAVVLNDPYDGSALMYALAGTNVLFPFFSTSPDEDADLLASRADEVGVDPQVCRAARDLGVSHLVALPGPRFVGGAPAAQGFEGVRAAAERALADPGAEGGSAWRLLAEDEGAVLLGLERCASG